MYKKEKLKGHIERKIVIGMIVSSEYLALVKPVYNAKLMTVPQLSRVAKWIIKYHDKYNEAPQEQIKEMFDTQKRKGLDSDDEKIIEQTLESINDEYLNGTAPFNYQYLYDQTLDYFKERDLLTLSSDIKSLISSGELNEADSIVRDRKIVYSASESFVEPFDDHESITSAMEPEQGTILFKMPGILGEFLGGFERDMLISFKGPEKRGKSFWLMETGMRALLARCNVATFIVGDMSQNQYIRRMMSYVARQPIKPGEIKYPVLDCAHNQDDSCDEADRTCDRGVIELRGNGKQKKLTPEEIDDYVVCTECRKSKRNQRKFTGAAWHESREYETLTAAKAIKAAEKWIKKTDKKFRLSTHPGNTISVSDIEQSLDSWELMDDFIADVIVIDYADVLAPNNTKLDFRQQINDVWLSLKSLSQKRHCLVITATQTDSNSYKQETIAEHNFSEDKRKGGHVNMAITLNQTPEEKNERIIRIGKMLVREDDYNINQTVSVLECRAIGRPYMTSFITPPKEN